MSTVSSDGWIRLFDLGTLNSLQSTASSKNVPQLEAIASYDTKGSRLTCCTLADGEAPVQSAIGKRKHEESEDSENEKDNDGELSEEGDDDVGGVDDDEWEDEEGDKSEGA